MKKDVRCEGGVGMNAEEIINRYGKMSGNI